MADYPINKGIGHSVEFKGLKAQYLFIFAGGLLAVFFLVVVLYMAGADQLVCIGLGLTLGSLLVWGTFHLNNKYGEAAALVVEVGAVQRFAAAATVVSVRMAPVSVA